MGCPQSIEVYESKSCPKSGLPMKRRSKSHSVPGQKYSIGAAILIQKWYRRYQARLEAHRRCTWMIYQTLEYAGEQNHLKLYNLYRDLLMSKEIQAPEYSDTVDTNLANKESSNVTSDEALQGKASDLWQDYWVPDVPTSYSGPVIRFPLDAQQLVDLLDAFGQHKRIHCYYLYQLMNEARKLLASRPNIQKASTSISRQITVVGDLHGQFGDLRTILHKNGIPDVTNPYIFNGDFVDRGRNSVETMAVLLMLLLLRPTSVFMNRGNHEDHYVNCQYGFIKELQKKYKSSAGYLAKFFSDLYRYLPLATIVDEKIFVCHGGVSENMQVSVLNSLHRHSFVTFLQPGAKRTLDENEWTQFQDLLWSDPSSLKGCRPNDQRGIGCFFGPDVSEDFLKRHSLHLIIRSHECKHEGFEWTHKNSVLTVFSASNYYTEGSNKGAYAKIDASGNVNTIQFAVAGGKKTMTLSQRVSAAEEVALTNLKKIIARNDIKLLNEFQAADVEKCGRIPLADWVKIMEHVLDLKLPWRTLQPQLVTMCKETHMVEYATTFQKINVRNALTSAPASVTEELYKQRDNLESIFRAMDKDNSGLVSLDEFKATCLRLPAPTHLDEVSITDLARSIDFNKDGQIDFNEFLEAFRLVETELGNV